MVRRHLVPLTVLAAACAVAIPLAAGNSFDTPVQASFQCPHVMAKKSGYCVPPGQAKKFYRRGDHILDNYTFIGKPGGWAPDPYGSYVQAGGYVYQVNRETHKVLRLIGAESELKN